MTTILYNLYINMVEDGGWLGAVWVEGLIDGGQGDKYYSTNIYI